MAKINTPKHEVAFQKYLGQDLFTILAEGAPRKFIEPFSHYPSQKEVLYPPGKRFRIGAVQKMEDGTIEVELKED